MKPLFTFFAFVFAFPVAAQVNTSEHFKPQPLCSLTDKSLQCVMERNQANIDRFNDKYKEETRLQNEKLEAERLERDRVRTVKEKDCNPRTQRCN